MATGRDSQSHRRGGIWRTNGGRRLGIEKLEERLALTWAGVPPTAITPPAGAVAVTLSSNDAAGSASIASTEVDYYSFTAGASGTYIISTATPSSSLDTVLGVFSSTGQRLSYNDDISYPSNTDSRVTLSLTAGAKYYVGITNYSSSSLGSYTWTIDGPSGTTTTTDDAYENNDTLGTAYNLGTLTASRTVNSLVLADSADWFRFATSATGTSSSTVSLSFLNSQGNLQLALYNSSGTQVGLSSGTGNSESVSLNGLGAGTYFVDIFGASGATNPNYSLTINPPTTTPPTTGGFQITLSMSGLTASQQSIFQQAAARWSQVITGDLPNATYHGQTVDDLLINASSITIDGVNGILGQAGPDAFRSGSDLPYHGVMQFDSADMASMESSGLLYSVVLHEMGHILGIGTLWEDLGLLSGAGTSNPTFRGANATAQYNQIFGTNASGVPVENTGGSGTRDSHWRESVFTNELMTGWAGPGTNLPLSRVTVGSLQDIGYTVNYAAADAYTPTSAGLAAGRSASSGSASLRSFGILAGESGVSSSTTTTGINANLSSANLQTRRSMLPVSHITPIDEDIADYVMAAVGRTATSGQTASGTSTGSATPDDLSTDACTVDEAWDSLASDWTLCSAMAVA